jgi:hypothetical protein
MNIERKCELEFLLKTNTAVSIIESRSSDLFVTGIYDDFYTIPELIESGLVDYVGKNRNKVYLRPLRNFYVHVIGEIKKLHTGEIVMLYLGDNGKKEFEEWVKQC